MNEAPRIKPRSRGSPGRGRQTAAKNVGDGNPGKGVFGDQPLIGVLASIAAGVLLTWLLAAGRSAIVTPFRLRGAALDRAGQTVREQLGEPCRILECAAFSEKCCAV